MKPQLTVIDPMGADMGEEISHMGAPLWMPWPVPLYWTFAGCASQFDPDRSEESQGRRTSTVASWMGQDPFGDPVEVLLVCEEAGSGLGSAFAGLDTHYPPGPVGEGPPHAKFTVEGRTVPLWSVEAPTDRAVFAGEAAGRWLWAVMYPYEASALVIQPLTIVDARRLGAELLVLPVGALSPRLVLA